MAGNKAGLVDKIGGLDLVLTETEMAVYLNLADAFISAPKTDLLSISVLEGMACGCTPILAELDAYKARVQDGVNGFFFRPDDANDLAEKIVAFLRQPQLKKRFSVFNVEQIRQKDDWLKNAPKLEAIYEEVMRKTSPRK